MPGFATSILQYEENVMLVADVAHKILRNDTVLDIMYELYDRKGPTYFHAEAAKTLVGQIVMTR